MVLALVVVAAACGGRDRSARRQAPRPAVRAPGPSEAPPAHQPLAALALPERPAESPRGVTGGVLRVHLDAEPPHLNPLLDGHQVIQRVVLGLVYETLLECHDTGYEPGLAESWEVSPDGLRVLLRLRPGARWHDDRPVSAIDVQASFEPLLRSTTHQPALRALLADVESVELMPDRVVRLRLARPSRLVLRALCEVPILPGDQLRGGGAALAQLGRQPIGSGPFRVASWERGKRIRLVRARPRGAGAPGAPFLDEISFEIDIDGARALTRTRRGDIDLLPRVLDIHYPDQVAPGALRETLQLYRLTPERYSFLVVNHRHGLLGDARFRRALAALWDRARLADEVHRGLARPIAAPPFGTVPAPVYDRSAAIHMLDDAGFRDSDGDGVRDRNGAPIRLRLLQVTGSRGAAAESRAYALDLRRAGLLLDVDSVDGAGLWARLKQGDFDLAPVIWEGRRDDDPRPLFGERGEFNFAGYRSDAVTALLDQLRLADGPVARAPLLQRIAELLAADQPVIFLYRHDVPALVSRRVHGLAGSADRFDLRGVWVDP